MTIKFEAGKTYTTFMASTGRTVEFKCTKVTATHVRGSFDGRKEKGYVIEPRWNTLERKEQGLRPDFYSFLADNRMSALVESTDVLEETTKEVSEVETEETFESKMKGKTLEELKQIHKDYSLKLNVFGQDVYEKLEVLSKLIIAKM